MSSLLFGKGTDLVGWVPTSETRGTIDILTTCVITLLLCVWTAVHINVSPPGSFWSSKLIKACWLIVALLAPELVAYTAWYQRQSAKRLMHAANAAYDLPNPRTCREKAVSRFRRLCGLSSDESERQSDLESQKHQPCTNKRNSWTLMHGFYGISGGYAIQDPVDLPNERKFLPPGRREVRFLTKKGLSYLLEREDWRNVLPDLSQEEISSKSRADGLTKSVVCIQAVWFIAQSSARLAQHIPVSLLELNTLGHCICALLIYALWWHKPFEVDYPTLLDEERLWDLRAFEYMANYPAPTSKDVNERLTEKLPSFLRSYRWYWLPWAIADDFKEYPRCELDLIKGLRGYKAPKQPESTTPSTMSEDGTDPSNENDMSMRGRQASLSLKYIPSPQTGRQEDCYRLTAGQFFPETGFALCSRGDVFDESGRQLWNVEPCYVDLTECDMRRWKRAWKAYDEFYITRARQGKTKRNSIGARDVSGMLAKRCRDVPYIAGNYGTVLGFGTAALIYGGLHVLAWNAYFRSPTEQLLWRVSACIVMGGLPCTFAIVYLMDLAVAVGDPAYEQDATRAIFSSMVSVVRRALFTALLPLTFLLYALPLFYVLARAYLVVELFVSLAHSPVGIYDTPDWSVYFPHIT